MMNSGEWSTNMTYTTCDEYNDDNPLPRRNVDLRRYLKDVRTIEIRHRFPGSIEGNFLFFLMPNCLDDRTAIVRAVCDRHERAQLRGVHDETGKSHGAQQPIDKR